MTPRERSPHRIRQNILLGVLAAVLVAALAAAAYFYNLTSTFDEATEEIETAFPEESARPSERPSETPTARQEEPSSEAVNVLILGSDAADLDAGYADGQRADTLMLMHIPADRENVYLMSIMRDLWIQIPGYGTNKINAALFHGGIPLTVQTVENLFNARIDHVVGVDFAGFKALTDALGGVTVDVPKAFTSTGPDPQTFPAGPMKLDGEAALTFVRERQAFPEGGYQRVAHQQLFAKAVLSKFLTAETLTNPVRIQEVVAEFSPYLSVDRRLDASRVVSLAVSLREVRSDDVDMVTLPTNGLGTSADGQSIVRPNRQAISDISAALQQGTLGKYLEEHPSE